FSCMRRPPPSSTLFPYTTLFRSSLGRAYRVPTAAVYVVSGNNADPDAELERALNDPETETIIHWEGDQIGALVFVPSLARSGPQDRKSTRLNSSHVKISYAVFCL